jgi:hypothetical protein
MRNGILVSGDKEELTYEKWYLLMGDEAYVIIPIKSINSFSYSTQYKHHLNQTSHI